jgi:hypothetical protein
MIETSWHSYPSIFNLGHRAVADLLTHDVIVEEKVDGSQFSFGYFPGTDFELQIRSKGAVQNIDAPEGMFKAAAQTVKALYAEGRLKPGTTYRAEYLAKPKHNALAYDRIPDRHLIIFDIAVGPETYLGYDAKAAAAERLGLEVVPLVFTGRITDLEQFRTLIDRTSILGGQKIEGVVVKPANYNVFGIDKKVLMGKFVSEAFREVHKREWAKDNPTTGDVLAQIAQTYCTPARWEKAIIHLLEDGKITGGSVKDIGPCMLEIPSDILKECKEDMLADLWKHAWPHIKRAATRGFPEYYKQRLLKQQFEQPQSGEQL